MNRHLLYLAMRYLTHHRRRTFLLWLGLSITCLLPLSVHHLTKMFEARLRSRAEQTPLLLGVRGNDYDLVLHALYFRNALTDRLRMGDWNQINQREGILAIPLCHTFRARSYPIIGTTIDYFDLRQLSFASGHPFTELGQCVVGATLAESLGLGVGDTLMSDPENVFDLAGSYPLKCRIVGVLAPSASTDDSAVFVDLKTQWIMEGLGHGHEAANPESMASGEWATSQEGDLVATAAVLPYLEITQANAADFHFHQATDDLPISAVLIWPSSVMASTLLLGDYQDASQSLQVIRPTEVVDSMMVWVLRVRSFLDWNYFLVALAVGSFLLLIVLLSLKLREEECGILRDLGGSRSWIFRLMLLEWGALLLASGLVAFGMARVLGFLLQHWLERSL